MSQESSLQGYILKIQDLGEADLLLTFFGAEEGKVRFVVRSAKKMTSRLAGRLQPTSLLEVSMAGPNGLAKLIGAQVIKNYSSLLDSQTQMAAVLVIQEFTNRALPDHQPNLALFQAYTTALESLVTPSTETTTACLARFLVQGLSAIGLAPQSLDTEPQDKAVFFSQSEGRFVLSPSAVDDLKIPAEVYKLYRDLTHEQVPSEISNSAALGLLKFLNDFAAYQLERPLLAVKNFFNLTS